MFTLIYNFLLYPIEVLLFVLSFFMPSLRTMFTARKSLLERWQKQMEFIKGERVLFHVSSVGELEQVRPVLESLQGRVKC